MKICNTQECWEENLGDLRDEMDDGDIDIAAEILMRETLSEIIVRDGDYRSCSSQSVGVGSLFQSGTKAEREMFSDALGCGLKTVKKWMKERGV